MSRGELWGHVDEYQGGVGASRRWLNPNDDLSYCRCVVGGPDYLSPICPGIKWHLEVHGVECRNHELARTLLIVLGMSANTKDSRRAKRAVLVVGGCGGMSSLYRNVVEKQGWSLRHYENRFPSGARRSPEKFALIVIMVSMVSHALLQQARGISTDGAPVVYLRTASVSALKSAVAEWSDAGPGFRSHSS